MFNKQKFIEDKVSVLVKFILEKELMSLAHECYVKGCTDTLERIKKENKS